MLDNNNNECVLAKTTHSKKSEMISKGANDADVGPRPSVVTYRRLHGILCHRSKRYHVIRDIYQRNEITPIKIAGTDNPADLLTKPLSREQTLKFCNQIFRI